METNDRTRRGVTYDQFGICTIKSGEEVFERSGIAQARTGLSAQYMRRHAGQRIGILRTRLKRRKSRGSAWKLYNRKHVNSEADKFGALIPEGILTIGQCKKWIANKYPNEAILHTRDIIDWKAAGLLKATRIPYGHKLVDGFEIVSVEQLYLQRVQRAVQITDRQNRIWTDLGNDIYVAPDGRKFASNPSYAGLRCSRWLADGSENYSGSGPKRSERPKSARSGSMRPELGREIEKELLWKRTKHSNQERLHQLTVFLLSDLDAIRVHRTILKHRAFRRTDGSVHIALQPAAEFGLTKGDLHDLKAAIEGAHFGRSAGERNGQQIAKRHGSTNGLVRAQEMFDGFSLEMINGRPILFYRVRADWLTKHLSKFVRLVGQPSELPVFPPPATTDQGGTPPPSSSSSAAIDGQAATIQSPQPPPAEFGAADSTAVVLHAKGIVSHGSRRYSVGDFEATLTEGEDATLQAFVGRLTLDTKGLANVLGHDNGPRFLRIIANKYQPFASQMKLPKIKSRGGFRVPVVSATNPNSKMISPIS
jgi:hypothetical protein